MTNVGVSYAPPATITPIYDPYVFDRTGAVAVDSSSSTAEVQSQLDTIAVEIGNASADLSQIGLNSYDIGPYTNLAMATLNQIGKYTFTAGETACIMYSLAVYPTSGADEAKLAEAYIQIRDKTGSVVISTYYYPFLTNQDSGNIIPFYFTNMVSWTNTDSASHTITLNIYVDGTGFGGLYSVVGAGGISIITPISQKVRLSVA